MLKNISNLGTVLNKSKQQKVKGGIEGGGWRDQYELCTQSDQPEEECEGFEVDRNGDFYDCDCGF